MDGLKTKHMIIEGNSLDRFVCYQINRMMLWLYWILSVYMILNGCLWTNSDNMNKDNDINGKLSGTVSASIGNVGVVDKNCNTLRRDGHNDGID